MEQFISAVPGIFAVTFFAILVVLAGMRGRD